MIKMKRLVELMRQPIPAYAGKNYLMEGHFCKRIQNAHRGFWSLIKAANPESTYLEHIDECDYCAGDRRLLEVGPMTLVRENGYNFMRFTRA